MASLRSPEGRKRAVFRADASAALGGGHVLRSLVLADQLAARGWACAFATRRESLATVSALRTAGHEIVAVDDDSPAALAQRIADGCDVLVVDHYGLDADFERASRAWAHRIVVIDDLADRAHDADLLIDPTLGRSAGDYRKLVPPACQLLLGPAFALLRPEFARSRPASLARDRGRLAQVFMCFGATDPGNHIGRLLPAVATAFPETVFDAVVGASAPHLRDVEAVARQFANVRLHVGARDVAGLLANADFAIGNAGTGAWERCALGVPGVALAVADNQKEIARTLTAAGASSRADASGSALVEVLRHATQESRATVGRAAANVCDGLGAMRVVGAIDPVVARDGKPVWLAPMTAADSDLVLAWQCAPGVRRFSRNSAPPSAEDHEIGRAHV